MCYTAYGLLLMELLLLINIPVAMSELTSHHNREIGGRGAYKLDPFSTIEKNMTDVPWYNI